MKVPARPLNRFILFYFSELVSFFFIAANFRALAQGLYWWTACTDMFLVFQGMLITKLMIDDEKARDWVSIFAFTFGGATGSVLSIWATRHLFGA